VVGWLCERVRQLQCLSSRDVRSDERCVVCLEIGLPSCGLECGLHIEE
jgi:hypothetical protein